MRIVVATGLYPPEVGGPATYSRFLEHELPGRGVDISVVPFSRARTLPRGLRHVWYMALLFRAAIGTAGIYALDPVSVGAPAAFVAFILCKPFVLRVAGDYAWEQAFVRGHTSVHLDAFSREKRVPFFIRILRFVERRVALRAQHVIVPSAYLEKIVRAWGVPKERISVIYNSFQPPNNLAKPAVLRKLLGVDGPLIVSAGRLVPWKGFLALIDAIALLRKHTPTVTLCIAGDGPQKDALSDHIKNRGLGEYVRLLGRLDHDTLLRYVAAADVFVLNTWYEGFSHQLLEAMSLGVPVVTTNVCGNPELVRNNRDGILIRYNDTKALARAMARVLTNKNEAKELGKRASERARTFSPERAADALMKVLTKTCGSS